MKTPVGTITDFYNQIEEMNTRIDNFFKNEIEPLQRRIYNLEHPKEKCPTCGKELE